MPSYALIWGDDDEPEEPVEPDTSIITDPTQNK